MTDAHTDVSMKIEPANDARVSPDDVVWRLRERVKELTLLHQTSRLLQSEKDRVDAVIWLQAPRHGSQAQ